VVCDHLEASLELGVPSEASREGGQDLTWPLATRNFS